ncbi:MAG: Na/Pi cotransporter family protein, partial [Papillibacter sp.]|nr:Na/Pi cotransporter family protein [Papillibacter sp.]
MDIFDILALIGGISLFLFGMDLMGTGLEKRAGRQLKSVLARMTSSPLKGFLLGLAVTAIIQSSAATTVMVVGFVNSGVMVLKQAIGVIMGANLGTTVTAWILSLTGIQGDSLIVNLLKPTSFVPILALIGVIMYMFLKDKKKKDLGLIFLGFSVLMFGMDAMTSSMEGLKNVPEFAQMIVLFQNPFLGVLAGAVITALIQSSS